MSQTSLDFIVARNDLRDHKLVETVLPALVEGQILLKVDKFAFTSNNVTYAAFGEAMQYWDFFPAPEGYGRIPVWGFADVVESKCEGIAVGERVYGYWPMSSHVVLTPSRIRPAGFVESGAHRSHLALVYNQYSRVAGDATYDAAHEDAQSLLGPLFKTAFFIDDLIADNDFFGAKAVVLSSASSKTALGVAYLMSQRPDIEVIGLTSSGNRAFVEGTGYYDRVVTYDAIGTIPADLPVVFVDMAGNAEVIAELHNHFRDAMKYSCVVGGTHWEARGVGKALPGPKPVFFFAPTQIAKRVEEWGPGGIEQRYGAKWTAFLASVPAWMKVVSGRGERDMAKVYLDMLDGRVSPSEGHMLSV
tara:strand:- start:202452 stop:203531 length:1080 start_codon:yes stop_codon:yes gene_type:complete